MHHLNRYLRFIESRVVIINAPFVEKHHILPKALFPEYKTNIFNIIKLTTREHFIAHYMLAKALGGVMWAALKYMFDAKPAHYGRRYVKITSRVYEQAKIEASLFLSKRTKANRSQETPEQKEARVLKWKRNFYSKTPSERAEIFEKVKITKGLKEKKIAKVKQLQECSDCHKCFKVLEKHICNTVCCIICEKSFSHYSTFTKHLETAKCQPKKKREKAYKKAAAEKAKAKMKAEKIELKKHKEWLKEEKERKRKEARESRTCKICNRFFSSVFAFETHIKRNNCHLSSEEKKKLSRKRASETMNAKSDIEKAELSRKLSDKRKEYLTSLTNEEKEKYHKLLQERALSYYNSDAYDSQKKSIQVKAGLKNAKDNRNRRD